MVRRRQHVRQIQRLFVLDFIRHNQTIDFSKWNPHVLSLPTSEASRKVRVAKGPGIAAAVHLFLRRRGIRTVAHRAELFLAVRAITAGNLERCDDALTRLKGFDRWSDPVNYTHKLVAKDIALLEGEDLTLVQVEVRAYVKVRGRGDMTNSEFGIPQMLVPVTLTMTSSGCVMSGMGASMTFTSFFPNHARAFIVSPPSRTLYRGVTSVGARPSFYVPLYIQYAQQVTKGVVLGTHRLKSVCECLHGRGSEEPWGKVRPFSR